MIPDGCPDVIIHPFEFLEEVHNEDYRYHRLPIGVLSSVRQHVIDIEMAIRTDQQLISHIINHGDDRVERLLFPTLYPNGRGHWTYRHVNTMQLRNARYVAG